MKNIVLYSHGGSKNHGCEAIVRGTYKILKNDSEITLLSNAKDEDLEYGINKIVNVKSGKGNINKKSLDFIKSYLLLKFKNDTSKMDALQFKTGLNEINNESIAISIGGDNYCYSDVYTQIELHKMYRTKAYKTVLWGCSVEPKLLEDEKIANDLSSYSKILARESISYEALKKINNNTKLIPDPAFQLEKIELTLPHGFDEKNTIGINLSPLIMNCEENKDITMINYEALIKHIIETTNMHIALIPHVVWDHNDDRIPLKKIFEKYKDSNRVILLDDYNCMELKGFISRCRMFIGARTHATIAAYSTCVPTLVIGYSVKARGIAKDIFGTYENYVLPVQTLSNKDDLINAFEWMKNNENEMKNHLNNFMPIYKEKTLQGRTEIEKLLGE